MSDFRENVNKPFHFTNAVEFVIREERDVFNQIFFDFSWNCNVKTARFEEFVHVLQIWQAEKLAVREKLLDNLIIKWLWHQFLLKNFV